MELKNTKATRQFTVDVDKDNNQVVMSFASQTPYLRQSELGQYYEILKCQPQYVDTSRLDDGACQLLLDHNWERTVGVCKNYWFADKKLYATCKFSRSQFAQGIKRDILDDIRRNVSIGYIVNDYKVVDAIDGIRTIEVTNWTPYQLTICSVPADPTVGYKRTLDDSATEEVDRKDTQMKHAKNNKDASIELDGQKELEVEEKETNVDLEDKNLDVEDLEGKSEEATEVEEETKENDVTEVVEDQQKEICSQCGKDPCECEKECGGEKPEEKECGEAPKQEEKQLEVTPTPVEQILYEDIAKEIRSLGQLSKEVEVAKQFIAQKKSLDDFKSYLKNKDSEKSKNSIQDENKMEKKYFSIVHAIRNAGNLNKGDLSQDYETQVINENKRNLNINDADIVLTTNELYGRALGPTTGKGAELIGTDYLPQEFVPFDRPQLTIDKVGSYSIPSNGNPISFAQCVSGTTAYMATIDGELSGVDMDFVLKTLTPHKAGCTVPVPYSLLLEGRPDVDSMVQADIVNALYQKRDEQVWAGNPTVNATDVAGIESLTGINIITGYSIASGEAWGAMLSAVGAIRKKNIFSENISFVMNTDTYVTLKQTVKNKDNCIAGFIIDDDDKIGKYPVYVNNAVSANTVLVGCGEYIAVSDFKGIGLIVDPYYYSTKQALRITAWASFDMVLRNLGAWTKVVLDA